MTLLSEALAQRKQALSDINTLSARLQGAAIRYDDDKDSYEDSSTLLKSLRDAIGDFETLSVRINKTNNATKLNFDGREFSIMEAVAYREALLLVAKHHRSLADHVLEQVQGRSRYGRTRTKDDIKQVATVDVTEIRRVADETSETVRRLDIALQQKNWTTEIVD